MRVIQKRPEFPQSNMRLSGVCFGGPCNQTGVGIDDLASYLDEVIPMGSGHTEHQGDGIILPGEGIILPSFARPHSGIPGEGKSGLLPADELKMESIKQLSSAKKKRKPKKGKGYDMVLSSIVNEIVKMGMPRVKAKKLLKTSIAKAHGEKDISKIAMIPLKVLSNNKKLLEAIEKKIKKKISDQSGGSFWDTLKGIAGTVAPFLPLLL